MNDSTSLPQVPQGPTPDKVPEVPDPWDLDEIRISQDFASEIGVKKVITVVPARKPQKYEFFRVHPEDNYRINTGVLVDESEDRQHYLVPKDLRAELDGNVRFVTLYTAINRRGDLFLFPV